jgi:hypothetical protein
MLLIVGGLLLFMLRNPNLTQIPEIIGSYKYGGVGFVGMLVVLYKTISLALGARSEPRKRTSKSTK